MNPILEALERLTTRARAGSVNAMAEKKLLRAYGDREGDGMVQMSFTLAVAARRPRARGRQALRRGARPRAIRWSRRWSSAPASTPTSSSTATRQHSVDLSAIHVEELAAQPLTRDEIEARGQDARPQDRRRRRLHRQRRAHRRHRRHPQLQGLRRREGARELQVLRRPQPRRPGRERRARRARARRSAPTPSWCRR